MPNWCVTAYVVEGNEKEIKEFYGILKGLEEAETPRIQSDFGPAWLGCLVDALGGDWRKISCRGAFYGVELDNNNITLWTETAWAPCNEALHLARKKFPSLNIYWSSEEDGVKYYETNDVEGKYFSERVIMHIDAENVECSSEYFDTKEDAYEWLSDVLERTIASDQDVDALNEELRGNGGYCYVDEFKLAEWD